MPSCQYLPFFPNLRKQAVRMGEFSSHVLEYLMWAKYAEQDPWLADDYHIAYLTVLWADRGHAHPNVYATQLTLGVTPDQVWMRIVAERKAKLGKLYSQFWPTTDKKPPQSERRTDWRTDLPLTPTARQRGGSLAGRILPKE